MGGVRAGAGGVWCAADQVAQDAHADAAPCRARGPDDLETSKLCQPDQLSQQGREAVLGLLLQTLLCLYVQQPSRTCTRQRVRFGAGACMCTCTCACACARVHVCMRMCMCTTAIPTMAILTMAVLTTRTGPPPPSTAPTSGRCCTRARRLPPPPWAGRTAR